MIKQHIIAKQSVLHAFNSHVSTGINPCINRAIYVLLMHGFGTLNTLFLGYYSLQQLILLSLLYMTWPLNMNINENLQPSVDCEMDTKYSARLFVNLGEYNVEFMQ